MKQHRKITPGDGLIGFDAAFVVDGELLKIRVDLDPAQAELQHTVKLLLKSVHAGIDRAEGEIAVVSTDGLGQKCVGVLDLTGIRCGVGDDAAGDARKLILRAQARHIGLPLDGNAVEAADGMRCLFGQLFRENMCVDVCNLHREILFYSIRRYARYAEPSFPSSIKVYHTFFLHTSSRKTGIRVGFR